MEVTDDSAGLATALHESPQHSDILQQVLTVEAAHGQPDDGVSGSRHTLHLHAVLGAHKKDLSLGALGLHGIGYRQGRKDMSARAATTYNQSNGRVIHHWSYFLEVKKFFDNGLYTTVRSSAA